MIVREKFGENTVRIYSDANFYIYGGFPLGYYTEAIDPIDKNRKYVETNMPINEYGTIDEETEETEEIEIENE